MFILKRILTQLIFLILLMNLDELYGITINYDKDYILDHEVSYSEAITEARKLYISKDPIPGCTKCTNEEMNYCQDGNVINDHCCCEANSFNREVFPFVEHFCRVGRQTCKIVAGNCAEYTRVRRCCCDQYLASIWKYMAGAAGKTQFNWFLLAAVQLVLFIYLKIL